MKWKYQNRNIIKVPVVVVGDNPVTSYKSTEPETVAFV